MNYKEYQELSSKTFAESGDETLNLLHCAIGASTEAGELLDAFKKHIYYKKELDVVNIGEEIADIQWYLFNLCRLLKLDMEQLLEANIAKLKARYGDKFSSEKALVRDLDTERDILESGVISSETKEILSDTKPITKNWTSYQETLSAQQKNELKREMLGMLKKGEVVDIKPSGVFKLSDVENVFNYLEEFDGHLSFKLLSNKNDILAASELVNFDLSSYESALNSVENIALLSCDFNILPESEDVSRFIIILEFNQLLGSLRLLNILANNQSTSLSTETGNELDKYLKQHGIEK